MFKYSLYSKGDLVHSSLSYQEMVDLKSFFAGILEELTIELSY
jgi:hypothetical protein